MQASSDSSGDVPVIQDHNCYGIAIPEPLVVSVAGYIAISEVEAADVRPVLVRAGKSILSFSPRSGGTLYAVTQ